MENDKEKFKVDTSLVLQSSALIVMGFYVIGFVVVNSYFGKMGIYAFDVFSARYVSAGILTTVIFTIFGITVARKFYYFDRDHKEIALNLVSSRWPHLWGLFVVVYSLAKFAFLFTLVTFLNAVTLLEGIEFIYLRTYFLVIAAGFFIDYIVLSHGGMYNKHPFVAYPASLITFLVAIYFGIFNLADPRIYKFYHFYIVVMIFVSFSVALYRMNFDRMWAIFWAAISVLSLAAIFGTSLYGEIRRELGGGLPADIRLVVTKDMPEYLTDKLGVQNGVSGKLKLLGETNDDLVILWDKLEQKEKNGLRFRKSYVSAILPAIE
jgi:hypothetical protein